MGTSCCMRLELGSRLGIAKKYHNDNLLQSSAKSKSKAYKILDRYDYISRNERVKNTHSHFATLVRLKHFSHFIYCEKKQIF